MCMIYFNRFYGRRFPTRLPGLDYYPPCMTYYSLEMYHRPSPRLRVKNAQEQDQWLLYLRDVQVSLKFYYFVPNSLSTLVIMTKDLTEF